ncbi:hypothetical protein V6251_15350 [Olleya sp. Ti.3.14]
MSTVSPFHLAIPVYNLEECRLFYRGWSWTYKLYFKYKSQTIESIN